MSVYRNASLVLLISSTITAAGSAKDAPPAQVSAPATAPATQPAGVEKIDVERFDALRVEPGQIVLDVRSPAEYADGHVPGAINVPMGKTFEQAIASYDKSKPYLVYCHSGKRSFLATKRMSELGFTQLLNFRGGIAAWEDAGRPMVKGATPNDSTESPTTKPAS